MLLEAPYSCQKRPFDAEQIALSEDLEMQLPEDRWSRRSFRDGVVSLAGVKRYISAERDQRKEGPSK